MKHRDGPAASDVDPVGAIRQYPVIVVGFVVVFVLIGVAFASTRAPSFVASTGLVVEDARSSSIFESRSGDAERYVADQVAILQSLVVAERASALAPNLSPGREIDTDDFLSNVTISFDPESNFLVISFEADDTIAAQVGANAMGESYREVISAAIAQDAETAVEKLDEAIDATVVEIGALQAEIDALRANNEERAELDAGVAEIVADLAELRRLGSAISIGPDPVTTLRSIEQITARAQQLAAELQARLLVADVEAQFPATALLLRRQQDASALLSELTLQRSQIEVDAQLAGNGVGFFAPAGPGRGRGFSTSSAVLVSTILGAVLGAGVAFWLSQRRQRVEDRLVPRQILDVPLLAEIPKSDRDTTTGSWFARVRARWDGAEPTVDDTPTPEDFQSPRAEAFRVLAAAVQRRISEWQAETDQAGEEQHGMVAAIVAPVLGEGTTPVSINLAMESARAGLRVVLVDGDLGAQNAFRMTSGLSRDEATIGLAEVASDGSNLEAAITSVNFGGSTRLSILGLGTTSVAGSDFFSSPAAARIMRQLAERYDLVVLDLPPLLQVAYSSAAIQPADRVVLVVRHGSTIANLNEARHRLDLIGVPMSGYVYFDAPARRGIASTRVTTKEVARTEPEADVQAR